MTKQLKPTEPNHFVHKPKNLNLHRYSPCGDLIEFKRAWEAVKSESWYPDEIVADELSMVGTDGTHHYFQMHGLTTGFARIEVRDFTNYKTEIANELRSFGWTSRKIFHALKTFKVHEQYVDSVSVDQFVECARFAVKS